MMATLEALSQCADEDRNLPFFGAILVLNIGHPIESEHKYSLAPPDSFINPSPSMRLQVH